MGKDTVFTINTHKNRPTTLKIHIVGFSNDTFSINNSIIHGKKIDDSLDLDWYTSELKITYKHMKADSGQIRINYALY